MAEPVVILNLGCGTKTSASCVNIDWSPYLVVAKSRILRRVASLVLSPERRERLMQIPASIVVHDLRTGIPADDASADAVYHSHMLEHIDRDRAPKFLREVMRVLKPGGIQRIVVPDMETSCRRYLEDFHASPDPERHEMLVAEMIEQMVRRDADVSKRQNPVLRAVETLIRGDARRRGETHQWMYDRISLPALLRSVGFVDVTVHAYDSSEIPSWDEIGLDLDSNGAQYKPDSLYVEARRPR